MGHKDKGDHKDKKGKSKKHSADASPTSAKKSNSAQKKGHSDLPEMYWEIPENYHKGKIRAVEHQDYRDENLMLVKPKVSTIGADKKTTVSRFALVYHFDDGFAPFILAPSGDERMQIPFGFKENVQENSGAKNWSGGLSMPWPTLMNASSHTGKKQPEINTNPKTRNITDTVCMIYARICHLMLKAKDTTGSGKFDAVENERDVTNIIKSPVYWGLVKDEQNKKLNRTFDFKRDPMIYLKLDAYTLTKDGPNKGKLVVNTLFRDEGDESVNIMDNLNRKVELSPGINFESVFVGATSSIQVKIYEGLNAKFGATVGSGFNREPSRVVKTKAKTAADIGGSSLEANKSAEKNSGSGKKKEHKRKHKKD